MEQEAVHLEDERLWACLDATLTWAYLQDKRSQPQAIEIECVGTLCSNQTHPLVCGGFENITKTCFSDGATCICATHGQVANVTCMKK